MKTGKIINYGTFGMIGAHIVCCGLPIIAALLGVTSPLAGVFSPLAMNIMLGLAGAAVAASWFVYFKYCGCSRITLWVSTILFVAALIVHLFVPHAVGVPSCH